MKWEEKLNNLNNLLNLPELAKKYADYEAKHCSKIVYREPMNQQEIDLAKKTKASILTVMWFVSVILSLVFIWGLFSPKSMNVLIIGAICFNAPLIITLIITLQKPKVILATVVYKDVEKKRSTERTPNYAISVIPESGEKIVYTDITASYHDAQSMEEGTRVLIIKVLTGAYACVL